MPGWTDPTGCSEQQMSLLCAEAPRQLHPSRAGSQPQPGPADRPRAEWALDAINKAGQVFGAGEGPRGTFSHLHCISGTRIPWL